MTTDKIQSGTAWFKQAQEASGLTEDGRNPALIEAERAFKAGQVTKLTKSWQAAQEAVQQGQQQAEQKKEEARQQRAWDGSSGGGVPWPSTPLTEEEDDKVFPHKKENQP